ncbi:membrane associated rhomboid family serine protease [Anoxybacillus tepidamans]|uniref:Membrane associated rhomboid family serine protease n=1 Tax=Anoxybacteroides tepidamans TaxID=265948 RepID=A0A7W8ISU4_9BACL|nr:rhomboid family intramembrane serine protease [Anoxybacillus tepidamans]MBB5325997.1 membrane associated rhomboid family serine protease [Anoxybacillus tepidamans]
MSNRTENVHTFFCSYPIVSTIILINIVFFFMFSIPALLFNNILKTLIGFNAAIVQGEYWRLITPLFLHLHIGHMIINSVSLVLFGAALEKIIGKWMFLVAYIGSGILANVATLLFAPIMYKHLGASGAIFGLFGVYSYLAFFHRHIINRQHAQIIFAVLTVGLMMTLATPHMNIIAHFFGFLSGAILAPFVASHPKPYRF